MKSLQRHTIQTIIETFFFLFISLVSSQYSDDYSDDFVSRKPEDVLLQNNSILLNGTCLKLNRGDVLKVTINSSGPIPYTTVRVVFKEKIQHLKLRFENDGKKLDDDECFIGEEEIYCGYGLIGSVATLTFLQIDPNLEMCGIVVMFLNETLTSPTYRYDDETEPVTEEPVTEEQKVTPCNCECECEEGHDDKTEPSTKEPMTEEPLTEEPVTEEPVTEEPLTKEPVTEEPVTEEPVTKEPLTDEQKVTPCDCNCNCNCNCNCKEATTPAQSDEKQAASNDSEKLKGGPTMLLTSLFLCLLFARRFQ